MAVETLGAAAGQLRPGTILGRYRIVSHLATGGMAEIYLARASGIANFEKLVVVKRILPFFATNSEFVEMFLDEARLSAGLHHPNIAQVFDIGDHQGNYFFTMEYVHGQDSRAVLKRNRRLGTRVPVPNVLEIVIQAAGALHYAHTQKGPDGESLGIVHRDVSPSNILITYDGTVKVVDFGVAKAAGRQRETRTGTLKGKISYMSPEQVAAEDLDARSDVFALGILFWELVTNRKLFDGPTEISVLQQVAEGAVMPPSALCPNIPPPLDDIVMKALARRPEDRFQSAQELQSALEHFAHDAKLMTSPRSLARYMRETFADELLAWEDAQRDGKSLAAHVVDSFHAGEGSESGAPPGLGFNLEAATRSLPTRPGTGELSYGSFEVTTDNSQLLQTLNGEEDVAKAMRGRRWPWLLLLL
ncbi:MAG: serine/threonine protein kinase, partial [Deltaproteobacteria bacterium]|nr:serine/threonine protein kinase [Deltaproteobacteria bacterium]